MHSVRVDHCNYIINLESSNDSNGTHCLALKIENRDCAYFDSYGMLPPKEIISFCKRIQKSHLSNNTKKIQDLSAQTCGFYAMAFLIFLYNNYNNNHNLYQKSSSFSNLFSSNTKLNNRILQKFFQYHPLVLRIYKSWINCVDKSNYFILLFICLKDWKKQQKH